jgi:hypothetical protein
MTKTKTIAQFIHAIRQLPSDDPVDDSRVWYKTQKDHWIGWLKGYYGPSAYGRKGEKERDARFAYNHVVNPEMLLWIISASKIKPKLAKAAWRASLHGASIQQKSAAIRRLVPWEELVNALWS